VRDAETVELRAHLATCQPDVARGDLGALLARFDVAATPDGG
jgi:hypothetical protein